MGASKERPVAVPSEVFFTGEEYAYRTADGGVELLGTKDQAKAEELAGL